MGLLNSFGNAVGGLFGEGFADRAAIAGALLNGNYDAASTIKARQAEEKRLKAKDMSDQQVTAHAYVALKSAGLPDDQAFALASDPTVAANFLADRNKKETFAASGGSVYDPVTNQTMMAPSRHEFQGSVFDVGGGAPGQQAPVTLQHEGVQMVTPQPMTKPFAISSFSGKLMGGGQIPDQSPPPQSGSSGDLRSQAIDAIKRGADPGRVLQRMQQMMQGGQAGQSSPAGFP